MNAPRRPSPTRVDVSALLSLSSRGAHLVLGLFILSTVTFTVSTLDSVMSPWPSLIAMVAVCGAGLFLGRDQPDPFALRDTLIVLVVVVGATVLVSLNLPDTGSLGRATWHLGACTWLLFFLAMRGRAWFAWLGMAIIIALTLEWSVRVGRGAVEGLTMVNTHVGILLVGTLFARSLRSMSQRINALNDESIAAASETAAADAGLEIRRLRARELAKIASPLLARIAEGGPYTAEEKASFVRAEARLRDGVRARALALPEIIDAVEAARQRGVEVVLLDDRGSALEAGSAVGEMSAAITRALSGANAGRVTIRLAPKGRAQALTIVAADGENLVRTALDDEGHVLPTGGGR